jgi:competence protein ComEC
MIKFVPYSSYLTKYYSISDKNIPFQVVHRGDKINFSPGIDITVLNPGKAYLTTDPINQNSIVLRVDDGKVAFLLTGDAGIQAEEDMLKDGVNVQADVLKVGHHGSRTATGQMFVDAVKPKVSIVSVGTGNTYGLPDEEPLARLQDVSTLYRTDYDGTVTVTTDGSTYSVTTQKTEPVQGVTSSSSGSVSYSPTSLTTTPITESTVSLTSNSMESTVYLSDLSLTDEWVKVTNKGSSPVFLGDWKIEDEGSKHIYTFPSYTLSSGSTVTLYTGKGTSTANELYWGLGSPIWNNDGDAVYVYDNNGKLVSELEK